MNYLVATVKEWNINAFNKYTQQLPGNWRLVTDKSELTDEFLSDFNPRYIFFPHWSWIVPARLYRKFECVCFHMADVPYGRGGSPLQNLIVRGHRETKLTALRMVQELDAGPVYMKCDLRLHGSATEIFLRTASKVYELIESIIELNPIPKEQEGEVVLFQRRTPEESEVNREDDTLSMIYDKIRMLDADTYPRAFLKFGKLNCELSNAEFNGDEIIAKVRIIRK